MIGRVPPHFYLRFSLNLLAGPSVCMSDEIIMFDADNTSSFLKKSIY